MQQKVLISIFPLHDFNGLFYLQAVKQKNLLERLRHSIKTYFQEDFKSTHFSSLVAYKNYFGEKMCIRHAFFRFYTVWFAIPALLSIFLMIY